MNTACFFLIEHTLDGDQCNTTKILLCMILNGWENLKYNDPFSLKLDYISRFELKIWKNIYFEIPNFPIYQYWYKV